MARGPAGTAPSGARGGSRPRPSQAPAGRGRTRSGRAVWTGAPLTNTAGFSSASLTLGEKAPGLTPLSLASGCHSATAGAGARRPAEVGHTCTSSSLVDLRKLMQRIRACARPRPWTRPLAASRAAVTRCRPDQGLCLPAGRLRCGSSPRSSRGGVEPLPCVPFKSPRASDVRAFALSTGAALRQTGAVGAVAGRPGPVCEGLHARFSPARARGTRQARRLTGIAPSGGPACGASTCTASTCTASTCTGLGDPEADRGGAALLRKSVGWSVCRNRGGRKREGKKPSAP